MPDYSCQYCFIESKKEYFTTKDKAKWNMHVQSIKHKRILDVFNDVDPTTAHHQFNKALVVSTAESRLQNRIELLESILKRNNIDFPK
jgi:hypothetical protein